MSGVKIVPVWWSVFFVIIILHSCSYNKETVYHVLPSTHKNLKQPGTTMWRVLGTEHMIDMHKENCYVFCFFRWCHSTLIFIHAGSHYDPFTTCSSHSVCEVLSMQKFVMVRQWWSIYRSNFVTTAPNFSSTYFLRQIMFCQGLLSVSAHNTYKSPTCSSVPILVSCHSSPFFDKTKLYKKKSTSTNKWTN